MSDAYKCDRCGRYMDCVAEFIKTEPDFTREHLCESCADEFDEFMDWGSVIQTETVEERVKWGFEEEIKTFNPAAESYTARVSYASEDDPSGVELLREMGGRNY